MKYVALGDSITEGIGSKKLNYIQTLQNILGSEFSFVNFAKTGTTIKYVESIIEKIKTEEPDGIIIMYGSVDAQIRADLSKNRFGICSLIPKRYKIGGMLEPRAFYSKKWYRIIPDRADNLIRKILKKIVLLSQGKVQWVDAETFEREYDNFLDKIPDECKKILVSTVYIDDKYFLNSSAEYEKFNDVILELSKSHHCTYIDLYSDLKKSVNDYGWNKYYSHDHFHPNPEGYDFIAKKISAYILGECK